jgi:hypothetical protein
MTVIKSIHFVEFWYEMVALTCDVLGLARYACPGGPAARWNRKGCGCACSPWPAGPSEAAAASGCTSPPPGHRPTRSPPWPARIQALSPSGAAPGHYD